jgi:hypothetical protein
MSRKAASILLVAPARIAATRLDSHERISRFRRCHDTSPLPRSGRTTGQFYSPFEIVALSKPRKQLEVMSWFKPPDRRTLLLRCVTPSR